MPSASVRRRRRAAAVSANASGRDSRSRVPAALPSPIPKPYRRRSQSDSYDSYTLPSSADDRRHWIPEPQLSHRGSSRPYHFQLDYAPPARVSGVPARIVAPVRRKPSSPGRKAKAYNVSALVFAAPKGVQVCVQRKTRKEVMHAKGHAGGRVRKPRRNSLSNMRCR